MWDNASGQLNAAGQHEETNALAGTTLSTEPAIFLVSHDMTVRLTNLAGTELLKKNSALVVKDGRLAGATDKFEQQLRAMVVAANDRGHRALVQCGPGDGRNTGRQWVAVSRRFGGDGSSESLIMLSLRTLTRSEPMLGREVMWIFGLTAAEARVAVQLAGGYSLAEIAETNGVNISTLRAQLRSVYAKTGTNKQAELVSRIWRAASL